MNNVIDKVIGVIPEKGNSKRYIKVVLDGDVENLASFIAKCPPSSRLKMVDMLDLPILSTIGNFLDRIDSRYSDLRSPLLNVLIKMQSGEVNPSKIRFENEEDITEEEFIGWVYDITGYNLG